MKVVKSYDSSLFKGAVIEVTNDDEATNYASAPHIANMVNTQISVFFVVPVGMGPGRYTLDTL